MGTYTKNHNMAGEDRNASLKEALFSSLTAILSTSQEIRASGEAQIKTLEVTEEFGVHLTELIVDPNAALALRQLASVLLKQYVETHWSSYADKFKAPQTTEQAKASIRQLLPLGLKESLSKVRSGVAYVVSAIASFDWPEHWPQLFDILMEALKSGNHDAVHGTMRVLSEFSEEITDLQMPQVAPVIFPELYKIFTQAEVFSIRTRGRAVGIFTTFAGPLYCMLNYNTQVVKDIINPVLPQFTEAFVVALQMPDGPTMDCGLKKEILQALTTLIKYFPKAMSQWINQILPPVWGILTSSAETYVSTFVTSTTEADDPVDSDGEILGFENLVHSVFEFINALIDNNKFRSIIRNSCQELVYYAMLYMQMTEDQEREWTQNPDKFIEDEDEDSYSFSVRIAGQDIILLICSEFPNHAAPALINAVSKHLQESEILLSSGNNSWWKRHETVLLTLASVCSMVKRSLAENKIQFDLNSFFNTVVLADMNQSMSPFLIGRCLWFASRYCKVISPELMERFLIATVEALQETQPACIQISAVRAVYSFCTELKEEQRVQMLKPQLSNIINGLISVCTHFSSEVLALAIETLSAVIAIDHDVTSSWEAKISPLAIAVLLKYSHDPVLVSLLEDLFKELIAVPACVIPVQQRLLPTLLSIFRAAQDKIPLGLQAVALDIFQTLLRGSVSPLPTELITEAFPAVAEIVLHSDDNSAIQSGAECFRAYIAKSLDQILSWLDNEGRNGIFYITQGVSRLLDSNTPEAAASQVGKLVSSIISKLGNQLGDDLDLMLRAVLSKLHQSEALTVIQSLLLVFAQLIHTQMDAVLNFLQTVPGPTGTPALEFVLTEWCLKQHLFYGAYDCKISVLALAKILQHAIHTNDTRLQSFEVRGDLKSAPNGKIRTRSEAAKSGDEWSSIPVLVKIYKIMIGELAVQIERNSTDAVNGDGDDEDEGWEDVEEEEVGLNGEDAGDSKFRSILDAISHCAGDDFYDDDETDDPDILNDPVNQINLQTYLTDFILNFSKTAFYGMFEPHLNDAERSTIKSISVVT